MAHMEATQRTDNQRPIETEALYLENARRSGDWWIYCIAGVSSMALVASCHTYIEDFWLDFKIPYPGWRGRTIVLVGSLLVQLMLVGITVGPLTLS